MNLSSIEDSSTINTINNIPKSNNILNKIIFILFLILSFIFVSNFNDLYYKIDKNNTYIFNKLFNTLFYIFKLINKNILFLLNKYQFIKINNVLDKNIVQTNNIYKFDELVKEFINNKNLNNINYDNIQLIDTVTDQEINNIKIILNKEINNKNNYNYTNLHDNIKYIIDNMKIKFINDINIKKFKNNKIIKYNVITDLNYSCLTSNNKYIYQNYTCYFQIIGEKNNEKDIFLNNSYTDNNYNYYIHNLKIIDTLPLNTLSDIQPSDKPKPILKKKMSEYNYLQNNINNNLIRNRDTIDSLLPESMIFSSLDKEDSEYNINNKNINSTLETSI